MINRFFYFRCLKLKTGPMVHKERRKVANTTPKTTSKTHENRALITYYPARCGIFWGNSILQSWDITSIILNYNTVMGY